MSSDLNRPLDELIQKSERKNPHSRNNNYNNHHNRNYNQSRRKNNNFNRDREVTYGRNYDSDRRVRKPESPHTRYFSDHSTHHSSSRPQVHRSPPGHIRHTRSRSDPPESAIRINNLHYEVSEKDLKELFESIGPVHTAVIDYDRAGRSNGSATVHFLQRNDAYRARERFQNVPLDGKAMQIEIMRAHPQRDRRMSMELDNELDHYMMETYNTNNSRMQID